MQKKTLRQTYQALLLDGIVPFWARHGVDAECGGVLSCMKEEGTRLGTDKYIWSQARWVWVCSALYNRVEKRAEFLQWARAAIDFLLRHGRDDLGRWVYRTTREGQVLEGATSIYSDCFVVYGLSEYCRAVHEPELLDLAKCIFADIQRRIEAPDFKETAPYTLPPNRRNHGVPMILTEVAGELARTAADAEIGRAADRYADLVMNRFVRPERRCLLEFLDRNYREVPAPEVPSSCRVMPSNPCGLSCTGPWLVGTRPWPGGRPKSCAGTWRKAGTRNSVVCYWALTRKGIARSWRIPR